MDYPRSSKYETRAFWDRIMGPNPLKLTEELMRESRTPAGAAVCDLGSGQCVTSCFLAKEYGFRVWAADLWSDPEENARFLAAQGLTDREVTPVKADATALPFPPAFFDAVVSTDSYNYFGRDPAYLGEKLLPFVKPGGYLYIVVPGMVRDCHHALPEVLLRSWTPEQLEYLHDADWWRALLEQTLQAEILTVRPMETNAEAWDDWLRQENEYAVGDRKSMEAGGGRYLNFVEMILQKR